MSCAHGGRESSCPLCFKDRIAAQMKITTVDNIQRERQERIKAYTNKKYFRKWGIPKA